MCGCTLIFTYPFAYTSYMHRFISMDKKVLVDCADQLSVVGTSFLIREGKEAEKGGYVCSVPLTYFCCRPHHCRNSP